MKMTMTKLNRPRPRTAVTRASAETALDARESAKAALLRAIEPVERGVTATEEDKEAIDALASADWRC